MTELLTNFNLMKQNWFFRITLFLGKDWVALYALWIVLKVVVKAAVLIACVVVVVLAIRGGV